MKLLYISNSMIPSRTANSVHVMKMCEAFAQNGHEVVLLTFNRKGKETNIDDLYSFYGVEKKFSLLEINSYNFKGNVILNIFNIFKIILKVNPDLVYGRYIPGCFISSLVGYKTFFETHSPVWESKLLTRLFFKLMIKSKNLKKIVFISQALLNMYEKKSYINSSILKEVAHDGATTFVETSKLLSDKNIKVGYVGHLYKGRGIDIIIECANKLNNVDFHVVGGSEKDIEYWKHISNDKVHFHGFVPPSLVNKYINSFDILLAPYQNSVSVFGGKGDTSKYMSPLKIFEYMSSGKTIIVSDLPVLREVLNDQNSVIVQPDNIDEWVLAIKHCLSESFRKKLSKQVIEDFKQYTWFNRANNILN